MANALATTDWKSFEGAVADFLTALDPKAEVTRDVMTADIHTGLPRQRDVWIRATFGGHIPIAILVSCKRTKAKVSQQQMDAFHGELRSSGANHGILYSAAGFTKPAIAKANQLGISCCMLVENGKADLPGLLVFDSYCFRERTRLTLLGSPGENIATMAEVFDLRVRDRDQDTTALAALVRHYTEAMGEVRERLGTGLPPTWNAAVEFSGGALSEPVTLQLHSSWRAFRARAEAWLINGSYCFNNQDFKGSYSSPIVDRFGEHPGPGWEEIGPEEVRSTGNVASFVFYGGDWEPSIREQLGSLKPAELAGTETAPALTAPS